MPSSKTVDKSYEYVIEKQVQLVPRLQKNKHAVSLSEWCHQNEDILFDIYDIIHQKSRETGRYIFDKETCNFQRFSEVAYHNSYKYKKHDTNYEKEEVIDADTVYF